MIRIYDLPRPETITRVALPNGITILVYENPEVESVVLSGSLEGGSIFEMPAQNGLSALTASALMRGTRTRDFDVLHGTLEELGADLSVGSGQQSLGFGGKALAEDLPVLVDLLNDVLRYPSFPADSIEKLKAQRLTELKYSQNDTRYRVGTAFREALFPTSHPYHYPITGTAETLTSLTSADLEAFHQKHYGPRGMIICIVGAVKAQDAVDIVQKHLADWENPNQPEPPALPPLTRPDAQRRLYTRIAGKTQSSILMGTLGPARTAPEYHAATLANSILGEFGMMGRIGSVIREQMGLAYYAYSRMEGGLGPGTWTMAAGVAPENVPIAVEATLEQVSRIIREPVSIDDLQDNQSYFTGRLPLRLENSAGIAGALQMMERYQLGLDYLARYQETINRLTVDDLLQVARQYLDPERFIIAAAGPASGHPEGWE
jgi:zinc protease